jgi:thiamine-phosphate pyrophosphorylase
MKTVDYTLYFITNSDGYDEETFLNKVKGACLGGATIVQLREKNKSTLEYYKLAKSV